MKATRYQVIPLAGAIMTRMAELQLEPTFEDLATLIKPLLGNGEIERVRVLRTDMAVSDKVRGVEDYRDMFVDEDGIAKGLAINDRATRVYWANTLKRRPEARPEIEGWPRIHGIAVLFPDRRVWF